MRSPEYIFASVQIKKEIIKFRKYLQERQFAESTIGQIINYTSYFLNWLEHLPADRHGENLTPVTITYNDILEFIDYCRSEEKNNSFINRILLAVRHYYSYLGQKKIIINPAAGIYLKGVTNKLPQDLLSFEELEELYKQYKVSDKRTKRNKIMLGIIIYQYPTTEELRRIQTTDINLTDGRIYIPGTRQSNGRMLELKSFQIMELQSYLNEIRPKLITIETNQLFVSMNGRITIKSSLKHLFRALKKINPEIKNPTQIRMSMLSHLQKTVPLRTLQYQAGHKHIHSTERYKTTNTDQLHKQLELFHPLR